MKTFIVWWSYCANYSTRPFRIEAASYQEAITTVFSWDHSKVNYFVFEVGGDLVHEGPLMVSESNDE